MVDDIHWMCRLTNLASFGELNFFLSDSRKMSLKIFQQEMWKIFKIFLNKNHKTMSYVFLRAYKKYEVT
jgi:hypothetical protein